jgi:hypothetical protein
VCSNEQTYFSRYRIIALSFVVVVVLLNLEEARMAGTGSAKSNLENLGAEKQRRKEESCTTEQVEEHNLNQDLKAEEEHQVEGRRTADRNVQQDLNQGMQTGTHDSIRTGINWGPAYQIRSTRGRKRKKKQEPNKASG